MSQASPLTPARRRAQELAASGDLAGARAILEKAVELGRANLSEDDPDVLLTAYHLGRIHQQLDDHPAARRVLEEAYAAGQWRLGDHDPLMVEISHDIGVVAEELGNRHEARKAFTRVAEYGPAALGAGHEAVARAQAYLGHAPDSVRSSAPPTAPVAAPGSASEPHLTLITPVPATAPFGEPVPYSIEEPTAAVPPVARVEPPPANPRLWTPPPPRRSPEGVDEPTVAHPVITPRGESAAPPQPTSPLGVPPARPGPFGGRPTTPDQFSSQPTDPNQLSSQPTSPNQLSSQPTSPNQVSSQPTSSNQVSGHAAGPDQVDSRRAGPSQVSGYTAAPDQFDSRPAAAEQFGGLPTAPDQFSGRPAGPSQYGGNPSGFDQLGQPPAYFGGSDRRAPFARPADPPQQWAPPPPHHHLNPAGVQAPGALHPAAAPAAGDASYRRRGLGVFAAIAAVMASLIAVAALVFVLADRRNSPPADSNVPTLAGRAPTGLKLADRGSEIEVSWTDPSPGQVSFIVVMAHPGEQLKALVTLGPGTTSYRAGGLNAKLNYCFAVAAVYSAKTYATSGESCTTRASAGPGSSTGK